MGVQGRDAGAWPSSREGAVGEGFSGGSRRDTGRLGRRVGVGG